MPIGRGALYFAEGDVTTPAGPAALTLEEYILEKLLQESWPPMYTRARHRAKRSFFDSMREAKEAPATAPATPPISSFHKTAVLTSPRPA